MAPSEDLEIRRGGRVQVEEVVSNKDLLNLTAGKWLDDIMEIGVIPWTYKKQESRKDGVQNWWK